MANQAKPPGASAPNPMDQFKARDAQLAMETAQVQASMKEASKLAEKLFEDSTKATGTLSDAYLKQSEIMKKIAQQQAEVLKIQKEMQDIEKERRILQQKMDEAGGKATEEDKKQLAILKEQVAQKQLANIAAKKQAEEQVKQLENLSKQQGLIGKVFELSKSNMLQYIASIASISSAISNYKRSLSDVLDVSALSGNYESLSDGMSHALSSATKFQMGMAEANVGLRLLGYSTEEVNASFKDFSVLGARVNGAIDVDHIAKVTAVTGRMAKLLGVSLPEATQHVILMQQRFGASTAQTAQAMIDIQEDTDKYNKTAGQTVLVGRDVSKVLFDIARESKGAAVEQGYLVSVLAANTIQLQKQGLNYQEALAQSSLYVKKLSAEAPDWVKILAGQDLQKQLKLIGPGKELSASIKEQLEAARPGLSTRITEILRTTSGYAQQKLLQEALSTTKIGMDAAGKAIDRATRGMSESQAIIAIAAINHISEAEAKSFYDQRKMQKELQSDVARYQKMNAADAAAELQRTLGVSAAKAKYLADQSHGDQLEEELRKKRTKDAAKDVEANAQKAETIRKDKIAKLEIEKKKALDEGGNDLADDIQLQINGLDEKKGVENQDTATAKKTEAVQGEKGGAIEFADRVWEYFKSPMFKLVLGVGILAAKAILNAGTIKNTISEIGAALSVIKKTGGLFGSGGSKAKGIVSNASRGVGSLVQTGRGVLAGGAEAVGAGGLNTAVGAASGLGIAAAVGGGAALGVGAGLAINAIDDFVGKKMGRKEGYLSSGVQSTFSGASKLLGGTGIESDDESKARGQEMFRQSYKKMHGYFPEDRPMHQASTVGATPVAAIPEQPSPAPTPSNQAQPSSQPGSGGQAGPTNAGQSMQTGQIIQRADGADYEITTTHRIPLAQIHAYNMNVAARGTRGPSGSA